MRPDNHLLNFRTRNGAFVPLLLFGLAAATLIGGCPWIEKPGTEETPSGGRQETTAPGGGSAGGGAGTTGGGETPASGSTIPQPPALSTGVHAATLQADEAKRYRLPMSSGESAIVNATVPDEATDVDLLVYAPRGTAPLSSSRNDAGMPDYVQFTATESGDYALEVVNRSASAQADCTLNFQQIPSDSSVQDALNGIYTLVESGGQPMPPGSSASWVIANGRLVSLFGVISADLLGLTEDLRYWVDVAPGNATELHYMGADIVVEVQNSEIMPLGDRNYLLSVSKRTTGTEAGSTPVVIEDTTQMLLALTADGCALCGSDVTWALTINGVPLGDIGLDVGPRLEKCPSSEVCDATPTVEPPAAPSSPQPSNGASDTSVDVDLNWADASRASSYDVYFGAVSPPPLAGNTASSSWPLGTLNHDTTYFWKVVAKNSAGSTPGPVWSFTTVSQSPQSPGIPSNPSPPNGATGVSPGGFFLDWASTPRAASYDIHLGTSNPPPFIASDILSEWPVLLGTLDYDTTYYWQIVAKNDAGSTPGPVWSFTTVEEPLEPPGAPSAPSPPESAAGVSVDVDLDWADAERATSYDVYFGMTDPPPFAGNTASSAWPLGTLNYETAYYWKVVAKNSAGSTPGLVWSFTTQAPVYGWHPLGSGMSRPGYTAVHALAVYNGELVAGGAFSSAGGIPANNIARWNGSAWQPLGTGTTSWVDALTVYNSDLIAGGRFTAAGGVTCNYVARWNGSVWQPLGSGTDDDVKAVTVYNGQLIAGGVFATAGGVTCNGVARWNGSTWQALGTGMDPDYPDVRTFTVHNGELVAGGTFTTAGGAACNNIARWNGTAWQPLGPGIDYEVWALALYYSQLIAGGNFAIGGGDHNNVARWNGSAWHPLCSWMDSDVWSLTDFNGELIVGGGFTTVDGATLNNIARWNGSVWQSMSTGMGGDWTGVFALAVYSGDLVAGGRFVTAGGVTCNHIAKWGLQP